ncbi:T9SS type B sorting domain-containing protein [Flavobacterium sp.]|uniref:T9SS type B sorting domain-containing protein n=1 Tax=Flavobacterium sp. TaxID=239 RepID=UPI002FDCF9AD
MKNVFFIIIVSLFSITCLAQNSELNTENSNIVVINGRPFENTPEFNLNDSIQRKLFIGKIEADKNLNSSRFIPFSRLQSAVFLCNNGGFEEFENFNSTYFLKNYSYGTGNPTNPMQCKDVNVQANQGIIQYNPNQSNLMATTVPSNYYDQYIGNINGFDQYVLKVNHKNSYITSGVVQTKRFKTNNETEVKFNFKAVLQSITGSSHENEQPYFKARIIKNNIVVSEFCLTGDPTNCIFTESETLEAGSIVLYTQNWQSGILDISSIPNNEEFIIEFTASRCGLSGHFGYAYVDDLCLLHSNENLQGSIEINPLFEICPTFPLSICGTFTIPNSGGINASVQSIQIKILNENNQQVYTSATPSQLDLNNRTFCFTLNSNDLPNTTNGNYNVMALINYGVIQGSNTCAGTNFTNAVDSDANAGWDISFLNCSPDCDYRPQTTNLIKCDTNGDGKDFFDLTECENLIITTPSNYTFSYFQNQNDAYSNTNPILNFQNFESYTSSIFVRVTKDATCYKIIPIQLTVKNPYATISGILNVCSGSTTLTASLGASYLWSTGETTRDIIVNNTGTYSVTVTDSYDCSSTNSVTILPNQVAVLPTIVVQQPSCFVAYGSITVTSPASEFSFDGGTTWSTSNIASNLAVGTYQVKIRTIMGCESYNSPITIRPLLNSTPSATYTNPTYCGDFGTITVQTSATEYSFDDGLTWTSNNVMTNLPIGLYSVRVKDAAGCISNPRNISIEGVFLTNLNYTLIEPYCSNLGSITITTPASEYSFDGGNTWQTSNTLNNVTASTYILQIKNNLGCTSDFTYVYVRNFETIRPSYTIDPAGCNKYATLTITTIGDEYSFDGGITWSTSNTKTNLNGGNTLTLIVRRGSCYSLSQMVTISSYFIPLPNVQNYSTLICDNGNNGNELVNLSLYESNFISNPANHSFYYYNSQNGAENQISSEQILNFTSFNLNQINKIIYVVVKDNNGCANICSLDLTLIPTPIISLNQINYLCENFTVTLTESGYFDSYLWSTGETTPSITVAQPGNYSLTVTEIHGTVVCSTTKTVSVILSNPATIGLFNTVDWTEQNNIITVNVTGLGDYEYSLNGIEYQDSNVFTNLANGEYEIFVRDKHGCGISTDNIYLLMYPRYFTPNSDGNNDFWKIKFSENEPNLTITIFDRHGKFITKFGPDDLGWDGTHQGKSLPSTDYWFVVKRENGKEYRGHFTLKR